MCQLDGTEPIDDDEVLYRRIPVSMGWYDPAVSKRPSPEAFKPRPDDTTGLSLCRGGRYNTPEQAAAGLAKRGYYIATLRVGDLREWGLEVVPRPVETVRGHVEIPELTAANWDTNRGW